MAQHIWKSKCIKHTILGPLLDVAISKKWTPLRREAHFQVKTYKTPQRRTTFGSSQVEKVHACGVTHMWKSKCTKHLGFGPLFDNSMAVRCRKSARRCRAKHISKSKVLKTAGLKPISRCQLPNLTNFSDSTNNYNKYYN